MINVFHYPEAGSWTYAAPADGPPLIGGGRDLERSMSAAEHALRQHLSTQRREPVSLQFAQQYIRHLRTRQTH